MSSDKYVQEMELFYGLLKLSDGEQQLGCLPAAIAEHISEAMILVERVESELGKGTHGAYFETSKNRYAHYYSAIMAAVLPNALILDIGNAPGHVAIGCSLMGHRVKGINLNAEWRCTYPDERWLIEFDVLEHDIERAPLPFKNQTFDAILFTEVLEHIAITHPKGIVSEIWRVLKPGGFLIFSTPNVCNISNMYALFRGHNIFWPPDIFYGSMDRHNREYTPQEVLGLLRGSGLEEVSLWGLNDYSNWRSGGAEFATHFVNKYGDGHSLCKNTIAGLFKKPL